MSWIAVATMILIVIAFGLLRLSRKTASGNADYPYQTAGPLFTPAERSFYGVLSQSVGESATIFGKVRVADIAIPRKGLTRSEWQRAFNKVSCKHFDFILCKNDDLSVICAIELDDSSHKSDKRQKRDDFLNGVCRAANIPLIQVPAKSGYVIGDVQRLLAPHLKIAEPKERQPEDSEQQNGDTEKNCPKCSSPMVVRIAKRGSNAGKKFWACSAYPKCRHVEGINA